MLSQHTEAHARTVQGVFAKEADLMKAFGTTDEDAICLEILRKGELQVCGAGCTAGQKVFAYR